MFRERRRNRIFPWEKLCYLSPGAASDCDRKAQDDEPLRPGMITRLLNSVRVLSLSTAQPFTNWRLGYSTTPNASSNISQLGYPKSIRAGLRVLEVLRRRFTGGWRSPFAALRPPSPGLINPDTHERYPDPLAQCISGSTLEFQTSFPATCAERRNYHATSTRPSNWRRTRRAVQGVYQHHARPCHAARAGIAFVETGIHHAARASGCSTLARALLRKGLRFPRSAGSRREMCPPFAAEQRAYSLRFVPTHPRRTGPGPVRNP